MNKMTTDVLYYQNYILIFENGKTDKQEEKSKIPLISPQR